MLLQQSWNDAPVESFSNPSDAAAWNNHWPADGGRALVKVLYDRAAGEVRVLGRWRGKSFAKTFVVEQDFATALEQAKTFIREQTRQ